ncbi:MAG: tetratricopeptide repeat protein [Flavobacteriaceae bacterium]
MKSKSSIVLLTLAPLFLFIISFNYISKETTPIPKAAMNIIKCTSTNFLLSQVDTTRQIAPLFNDLGNHFYTISTNNKKAQAFFNQGLNLAYAFNHAESHRSFMEVARLDPNSAMAYWGQAYVLGPNINDQLPDAARRQKSYEAIQKAKKLTSNGNVKEQDLIHALSFRYSKDSVDIKKLNLAYMDAMAKVADKYPTDPDILTLYAAAIMNTVPWNYWDKNGNPSPNIKEAKLALENAKKLNSKHPGANHYYIHMVELPKPDLGVESADILNGLDLGAGHLVHMPGHIYMRVGRYEDAVKVNQKAILSDERYISQCFAQGLYPLVYYPHNIHFLWSAASMLGNSELAIDAAKKTAEKVPVSLLKDSRFHQSFASSPILAYTRFGKWNDVLTMPNPGEEHNYMQLIWHYARGIAFLRKDNLKDAKEELEFIANRDKELDFENISLVAYEVLAGEIEAYNGNLDEAISHLEKAVTYEDELPYDEPSVWYIPTRQTLGAILLKAKKYKQAEKVYREDLAYYRQNGWSLKGLYISLIAQDHVYEAEYVKSDFEKAWVKADIEIDSSVL